MTLSLHPLRAAAVKATHGGEWMYVLWMPGTTMATLLLMATGER